MDARSKRRACERPASVFCIVWCARSFEGTSWQGGVKIVNSAFNKFVYSVVIACETILIIKTQKGLSTCLWRSKYCLLLYNIIYSNLEEIVKWKDNLKIVHCYVFLWDVPKLKFIMIFYFITSFIFHFDLRNFHLSDEPIWLSLDFIIDRKLLFKCVFIHKVMKTFFFSVYYPHPRKSSGTEMMKFENRSFVRGLSLLLSKQHLQHRRTGREKDGSLGMLR